MEPVNFVGDYDCAEDDGQDEEDEGDGVGVGSVCVQCFALQLATRYLAQLGIFLNCKYFVGWGQLEYFLQNLL